jgi:hypothetical protein
LGPGSGDPRSKVAAGASKITKRIGENRGKYGQNGRFDWENMGKSSINGGFIGKMIGRNVEFSSKPFLIIGW